MPKVIHKEYIPLATLILLTIISVLALTSTHTYADNSSASADVGVNVFLACTLSGSNISHAITLNNGSYNDNITGTTLHTICNGSGNYNIYAIGYTNNTDGNNAMHLVGSSNTAYDIPTGTTLDGTTSNWAMKLSNNAGNTATIENGYSGFSVIPSTSTLVASYSATSSNQTTDSTLQTTYGVSISPNQPAGTYTGQVKYTMDYTEYKLPYIQDLTLEKCMVNVGKGDNPANVGDTLTVYDKRDGNDYTVRYINGACWMTQNLRITGTISAKYSNFTGGRYNVSAYDFEVDGTDGGNCFNTNSYSNPCSKDSGSTATGVWYNYCAATAGTICTDSTSTNATEDICPAGWHLPTGPANITSSDLYKIYQSTSTDWIKANTHLTAFGPVPGGDYAGSSFLDPEYGFWWSATASNSVGRYGLDYDSSENEFYSRSDIRTGGFFVRCVRTS